MLIDSHVNLHAPQFDADRQEVIDRARAAGIALMVNISDRLTTFPANRAIAQAPDIWCTVGVHPHEAKDVPDLSPQTLLDLASDPKVVHTREADELMTQMLEEAHARAPFRMLLHCYTSGAELARRAAALGAWFSVSGIATFKAAEDVRAVIRDMPADRIIVETDCPYLAPVPHRGRRNEPAFLPAVLAGLATVRGWSPEEAEARCEDAFFALFDRIPRP